MTTRIGIAAAAAFFSSIACGALHAQGLPTQTWPAGTQLSTWNHGGRITTFHRGYLYLGGLENQATWTYDISDPQVPELVRTFGTGVNGHTWSKVGDVFWRAYWIPELGDSNERPFHNLANPLSPVQQTQNAGDFLAQPPLGWPGNWIYTYPHLFGSDGNGLDQGRIHHASIGWWPILSTVNVRAVASMTTGANQWRIGNLLFLTPSDTQNGVAVFDIGNPLQPVLLDRLTGNFKQYTNAWQVWRNNLVLMFGDNTNGPDANANALVIDFSDPTNLTLVDTIPYDDLPGRYAHFQDEYAFAGRFNRGVKYNMVTRQVEETFTPNPCCVGDFQWIPIGHLVLASGSETDGSRSVLFTHQDGLDTRRPTIGYHLPRPNATHQPLGTVIGFVINETLDSPTVTSQNIRLRTAAGAIVATTVIHTSYNVVNVSPDEPLLPDTTYEVSFVANGVRDVAGNGFAETSFRFSTGATVVTGDALFDDGFEAP
jgi:hypothetical protein